MVINLPRQRLAEAEPCKAVGACTESGEMVAEGGQVVLCCLDPKPFMINSFLIKKRVPRILRRA